MDIQLVGGQLKYLLQSDEACKILEERYDMGGCYITAFALKKWFSMNHVQSRVLCKMNKTIEYVDHIVVNVNNYLLDSKGAHVFPIDSFMYVPIEHVMNKLFDIDTDKHKVALLTTFLMEYLNKDNIIVCYYSHEGTTDIYKFIEIAQVVYKDNQLIENQDVDPEILDAKDDGYFYLEI
jgi:hypothetical protein